MRLKIATALQVDSLATGKFEPGPKVIGTHVKMVDAVLLENHDIGLEKGVLLLVLRIVSGQFILKPNRQGKRRKALTLE